MFRPRTRARQRLFSRPMRVFQVPDYVKHEMDQKHVFHNTPFSLLFQSTVTEFEYYAEFFGLNDLESWMNINFGEELNYARIQIDDWAVSIFDVVRVDLDFKIGGCSKEEQVYEYQFAGETFLVWSPKNTNNNCGLLCLRRFKSIVIPDRKIRKEFGLKWNEMIPFDILYKICGKFLHCRLYTLAEAASLSEFPQSPVILCHNGHYSLVLKKFKYVEDEEESEPEYLKRGFLFYDLETRQFDGLLQKETIIHIVYQPALQKKWTSQSFTSFKHDGEWVFAGQQFLKFLEDKCFTCYAHNASRFDLYFLLSYMKEDDLFENNRLRLTMRGLSALSFKFYDNEFKDSCAFLTKSLDSLCKDFNTKHKKIDDTELCFYKPELNFEQFMDLRIEEPEFWSKYNTYCEYDVLALRDVVMSFNSELNLLVGDLSVACGFKRSELAKRKCNLKASLTIGGLAKKLFLETAGDELDKVTKFIDGNLEKSQYLQQFIRGGISYVQYPGKHTTPISLYDIKSMYPAAMMYMRVPVGESRFVVGKDAEEAWDKRKPGYYHLHNVEFYDERIRPIAHYGREQYPRKPEASNTLCWKRSMYEELFVDSEMFRFLIKLGLQSYEVVEALVSEQEILGSELFKNYVSVLYKKKQEQDDLPKDKRNNALRETIKLFLNALSGKLIENPGNHKKFVTVVPGQSFSFINGAAVSQVPRDDINDLAPLGLGVYSYSKRLLWEYIRLLPNRESDVIATETDSIYIPASSRNAFENNILNYFHEEYPCVKIGDCLGNFAFEEESVTSSYFLGKKIYYFGSQNPKMKFKGVRPTYIDENGKFVQVLDEEIYKQMMDDGLVEIKQTGLKRVFNTWTKDGVIHIENTSAPKKIKSTYEFEIYHK